MIKRMKAPTLKQLQKRCADWNARFPVGTAVEYHPVIGAPAHRLSKTTTEAQILFGHSPVVWLADEPSCVHLDALVPRRTAEAI